MSVRINKTGVVWAGILICVCCAGVVRAEEKAAPPPPDPYANAQILVEAFVVEVPTSAMAEMGISPIGQGSDGITVAKLGACLVSDEGARVISGAKVSAKQGREGKSQENKRCYLKEMAGTFPVSQKGKPAIEKSGVIFRDYNFSKKLEVSARIISEYTISTEYTYSESGILTDPKNYDPNNFAPPDSYSYDWEGILSLSSGKPVIAGAAQNKDRVVFLILTATVQDMPEVKQKQADIAAPSN